MNKFMGPIFFDPVTAIAIGVAAVGTAVSVKGQQDAATATKRAGRARAGELAKEAVKEAERGRRLRAQQRAAFGAAGVNSSGSPLQVQGQSLIDSILDQEAILAGAKNINDDARRRARAATTGAIGTAISGIGSAIGGLSGLGGGDDGTSTVPGGDVTGTEAISTGGSGFA